MNKFKKIFSCQTEAKKYGLDDIELYFDKNVEFPYYGLPIAEKISHEGIYEYISYFKEDNNKLDFKETLAYMLLVNPNIITPCTSREEKEEDGVTTIIEKYKLIYFNENSSILKPTALYTYQQDIEKYKENKETNIKIGCEYLFVFDNQWLYPYEEVICLGQGPDFVPLDYIRWNLEDIKTLKDKQNIIFSDSPACSISTNSENGEETIELEVCNINGEYTTLYFTPDKWETIPNSLCSVRFVEVKEKKYGEKEYKEINNCLLNKK